MALLRRLREGLRQPTQQLVRRVDEVAAGQPTDATGVTGDTVESLEEILLSADVGLSATERILSAVRARADDGRGLRALVRDAMLAILEDVAPVPSDGSRPRVVLVVGVNGTGKTTTVGKLAKLLKTEGVGPLICAADTFRAAAVDQLDVWASRAEVGLIKARPGADPAAVVYDAIVAARARDRGAVIVDTAGRLHTRANLMAELEKIARVAAREVSGAPQEVLLVLDATVGQNGIVQAREFARAIGVNGIVLTKLDGTAKGGVAIAVASDLRVPIRYVGVGEGIDDLVRFTPGDYVDALFDDSW